MNEPQPPAPVTTPEAKELVIPYPPRTAELTKRIHETMLKHDGNRKAAAAELGIARKELSARIASSSFLMKKWTVSGNYFKQGAHTQVQVVSALKSQCDDLTIAVKKLQAGTDTNSSQVAVYVERQRFFIGIEQNWVNYNDRLLQINNDRKEGKKIDLDEEALCLKAVNDLTDRFIALIETGTKELYLKAKIELIRNGKGAAFDGKRKGSSPGFRPKVINIQ